MQDYKSTQKLAQEREGASLPRPNPVIAAPSRGRGAAAAGGVPDLEQGLLQRDEEVDRVALLQVSTPRGGPGIGGCTVRSNQVRHFPLLYT